MNGIGLSFLAIRLLFILALASLAPVRGADGTTNQSSSEYARLYEQPGMVIDASSEIETFKGKGGGVVHVTACEISASGEKLYAIKVNQIPVYPDEIAPLLNAIDSLGSMDKTVTKLDSFVAIYTTRDGLKIVREKGKIRLGSQTVGFGEFEIDELTSIRTLIVKEQATLKSIQ